MAVFIRVQASRKVRRCGNCLEQITPGQRYQRHAQTPDDEHNDGQAWRTHISHLPADCPLNGGERPC